MDNFQNNGNFNAGGDINITDNSCNNKLLINCTSEELLSERPFRKDNFKLERKNRVSKLLPFFGLITFLCIGFSIWAFINNKPNLITLFLGGGSLLMGYISLYTFSVPNEFQKIELSAINEINMILKSRRVE